MGYFPNGSAGMDYEHNYCRRCIHLNEDGGGCAIWLAHMIHNYDECNKKDSILHLLIPRDEQGFNKQCELFVAGKSPKPKRKPTRQQLLEREFKEKLTK